jgi:hypothetical protein
MYYLVIIINMLYKIYISKQGIEFYGSTEGNCTTSNITIIIIYNTNIKILKYIS